MTTWRCMQPTRRGFPFIYPYHTLLTPGFIFYNTRIQRIMKTFHSLTCLFYPRPYRRPLHTGCKAGACAKHYNRASHRTARMEGTGAQLWRTRSCSIMEAVKARRRRSRGGRLGVRGRGGRRVLGGIRLWGP